MTKRVEWEDKNGVSSWVEDNGSALSFAVGMGEKKLGDFAVFYDGEAPQLINAIAEVCGLTVMIGEQPPVYDAQFDALAKRVEEMEERFVAVWNKSSQLVERVEALESAWLHDDEPQDEPEPLERIDAKLDTILDRITAPGYTPQRLGQQYQKDGK